MKEPKAFVLDSWAIMAFLEDEPPAQKVEDLIADARRSGTPLLMTVVNAGEVWYSVARKRSAGDAEQALEWLAELGVELVNADLSITLAAARYKAKGGVSYADCFAAALAKQTGATLVTGDREFRRVAKDISIEWL